MLSRFVTVLDSIQQPDIFVVALSGGLDSTALLHLMANYASKKTIAVHVNHGLSPNADQWQHHCAAICEQLKIPFYSEKIDVSPSQGESIENVARELRYAALKKYIEKNRVLLTAHTKDDQAETFLLQALRGAGPKGLAAMSFLTSFGLGRHCRPLLSFSREELGEYVRDQKLTWIEDESNQNTRFDRNFLRRDVLPTIKERWPSAGDTITRAAMQCARTTQLLEEIAAEDLRLIQSKLPNRLSIEACKQLSFERQNNVLRFWFRQFNLLMPSEKQLQQIKQQFFESESDAQPLFTLQGYELRRYRDDLYLINTMSEHDEKLSLKWNTKEALTLPNDLGVLQKENLSSTTIPETVCVRFRQGGEKLGKHCLKKMFQEWGVPPWLRSRVPLIYDGDNLIEVVGFRAL